MSDKVMLFGEVKSPKAYTIRDFLQRNDISFEWIDVSVDRDALRSLRLRSSSQLPVLTIGALRLYAPNLSDIVAAIGFSARPGLPEYDLAIIGAGPAGLRAAVYGASEGLRTVLVERFSMGDKQGVLPELKITSGSRRVSVGRSWLAASGNGLCDLVQRSCWRQNA